MSEITFRLEPVEATFGDVVYPPGGKVGPRRQTQVQFFLLYTGSTEISLDGKEPFPVPVQHAALLLPGHEEVFRFARRASTHHGWCCLRFESVPGKLLRLLRSLPAVQPLTRWMRSLVDLGTAIERSRPADPMLLIKVGEALFYEYAAAARRQKAGEARPAVLDRALQFLAERYSEPVDLPAWARFSGVSVNHLIRLFKKHFRETPSRYLWRFRTEQGLTLLRETGLGIAEIAYQVGFQTPFHFSRLIKACQQTSPKNLRARLRKTARRTRKNGTRGIRARPKGRRSGKS